MSQAPKIDEVRLKNVAATYVLLEWDDIGGVFTYELQKSANGGVYIPADFTAEAEYFEQKANPNTEYVYRVRAVSSEYEPGEWSYSEKFKTFKTNSYAVLAQSSVSIYQNFINEKLIKAQNIVDFNEDAIEGVLIREGYNFSHADTKIDDLASYILYQDETLKIYGETSASCGDRKKLMPVVFNDYLFMFERYQPVVRYSTNAGQSWLSHPGISGRVGAPVGAQVGASSDSTLYVIGYDGIYTLSFVTDVRMSSIEETMSSIDETLTGGRVGDFKFGKLIGLPPGVPLGGIDAIAISDDQTQLFVAAVDTVYRLNLAQLEISQDPDSPDFGRRIWSSETNLITGNGNAKVKNLVGFGNRVYAYVCGELADNGESAEIVSSPSQGIYEIEWPLSATRVYGEDVLERSLLDPNVSNLSRSSGYLCIDTLNQAYRIIDDESAIEPATPGYDSDDVDPERVDYAVRYEVTNEVVTSRIRPFRQPLKSTDGRTWFAQEENYHYESQYLWYSENRIWVNYKQRLCVIERRKDFTHTFANSSETLNDGTFTFYADSFSISNYPGYTIGLAFYKKETGALIGFYNLGYRTRDKAMFTWIPDRTVMTAILASNSIDIIDDEPEVDSAQDIVPPLDPFVSQFLPEHFIQTEPLYVEFVEEYLKFLSSDAKSDYGMLYNLIRNHDVNETAYLEMFYNDLSKRNVYLQADKWEELLKFINNRAFDIYSVKGIKEAYRFLFKFLYNEDVIITTESDSKYEFGIVVSSTTVTESIVGNKVQTPDKSGQADVAYYEKTFGADGTQYWELTLNNIIGEFVVGDDLVIEEIPSFAAKVVREVAGKEKPINNQEYLDRGPTYYNISLQSPLQVSKYRDDLIRFVHPVGFGFVGILLITMFINSGVSAAHKETIVDILQTLKWDSGLPKIYPQEIPDLDSNGNYKRDQYGNIQYKEHPLAGQPFPLTPTYMADNPGTLAGRDADQRRRESSFLLDSSNMRFIESRKVVAKRLKDGVTQRKDS